MNSPPDQADRPPLPQSRQVTIDALCEHFANDVMSVEEFERRVDAANRATTSDELKDLLRDMPGGGDLPAVPDGTSLPAPQGEFSVADVADVREHGFQIAIMGGTTRRGRWRPARNNFAVGIMGGADLDFREALIPPGETTVYVLAMWGGVDIVVPVGVHVETYGIGIMGGFDQIDDARLDADPDAPVLRIIGAGVMGGVGVSIRHPGESAGDARRRRRLERKEQKEQKRLGRGR